MPTISTYSPGLALPQYTPTDYSNQLEMQLLQKKQSQYDNIVQRLSNMQGQSLNISMLNLKGKEKLDMYNKELGDMLSQDLGDLTDPKVQSKVAGFFNKVAYDSDLKQRSQLSSYYQKQLSMIEGMRNSKDPTKSGYNAINETVFRKWNGGLEDFMMADNVNGWESKMQGYTPYKDIDQKLVNITKLLHAESKTLQKPVTQKVTVNGKEMEIPTGYDVLESNKGVSPDKIRTLLETTLDQDERSQLDVLAKYRIIENNSPEGKSNLYGVYSNWLKREHQQTQNQLEQIKGLKLQLDPSKVDSKLSPEEQAVKKALYQQELDKLSEQEQYLTTKLGQQLTNSMSEEEWLKKDNTEIFPFIRQITNETYVNGIASALSWKDEVEKAGMDESYFAGLRIQNMQDRLKLDAELGRAGLKLKEEDLRLKTIDIQNKINKDSKGATGTSSSPAADITKSSESVFENWNKVTEVQKTFNDKLTPIITSKNSKGEFEIDPKNLTNRQWLDSHSQNHEVNLWNIYVSKFRDSGAFLDDSKQKPNLAGFELFKKQVANGDYKNDLTITNQQSEYDRDSEIGTWLNQTVGKVAQTINNSIDYKSVSLDGKTTLQDYAKANNWNGQGEMVFGIRDGKGGYKQMTWTEVKNEYQKIQDRSSNISDPLSGNLVTKSKYEYSILDNDPSFKELVGEAIKQESKSSKMIQEIYTQDLPQILQGKQYILEDKKDIGSYIGYVNEATKLVGEDSNIGLTVDDLTQVTIPSGIGEFGYFMVDDKTAKRLEGKKLIDVSGEPKSIEAGVRYRFKPPVRDQYDVMLNAKFENTGTVKRNIKGYNVTINDIPNNGNVRVLVSGQDVNKDIVVPRKDVSLILREVETLINQMNENSASPK